jgi:hypothetical protein
MTMHPRTTFDADRNPLQAAPCRGFFSRAGAWLPLALALAAAGLYGCDTGNVLPSPNPVIPGPGSGGPAQQPAGGNGFNAPPTIQFTWPTTNLTVQDGTRVVIQYQTTDPTDDVRVTIFVDPDGFPSNGNEIILATGLVSPPPQFSGMFEWNTTGFPAATYFVRATADDGFNPPVMATALGTVRVLPRPGDPPGGGDPGDVEFPNETPQLFITEPFLNETVDAGTQVRVSFTYIDRDSAPTIRFLAESVATNDEIEIFAPQVYPQGAGSDFFTWDTTGVDGGEYRIIGIIDDGEPLPDRPVRVVAFATVTILPAGTGTPSLPPQIQVTDPPVNRGVRHEDVVTILMRLRNDDPQETLTVTVYLDLDTNPNNNDLNFPGGGSPDPNRQQPLIVIGAFNIGGYPANQFFNAGFQFVVDTAVIPIRRDLDALGRPLPYFIRVVVDDGVTDAGGNRIHRVSGYAPGGLFIQSLAAGVVDLRDLNFMAGATFHGAQPNDYLGTGFLAAGDIFEEAGVVDPAPPNAPLGSADDFVMIARYGTPRNRKNVGAAFVVLGRPNHPMRGRFSGINSVVSIGPRFAGAVIASNIPTWQLFFDGALGLGSMPPASLQSADHPGLAWSGITSVAVHPDLTGDGLPDFLVGVPFISGLHDIYDPDPCDATEQADTDPPALLPDDYYTDGFQAAPHPTSPFRYACPMTNEIPEEDDMYFFNCIDGTPVDQGYMYVVSGQDAIDARFADLRWTGQMGPIEPGFRSDDEGIGIGGITPILEGVRFRGGSWEGRPFFFSTVIDENHIPMRSLNEFGRTVAVSPPLLGEGAASSYMVSSPVNARYFAADQSPRRSGSVHLFRGQNLVALAQAFFTAADRETRSLPVLYRDLGANLCPNATPNMPPPHGRRVTAFPDSVAIWGEADLDRFGYGQPAGDVNNDGRADIVCGASRAGSGGFTGNGKVYIILSGPSGFGPIDLATDTVFSRLVLRGVNNNDFFGENQMEGGDINGNGLSDVIFSSGFYDEGVNTDSGFVGVVFGGFSITGIVVHPVTTVGTATLPGVKFRGVGEAHRAGASISAGGDFNGDGYADILIAAPGEQRVVAVPDGGGGFINETRLGVAYLIFGGPHLTNGDFTLDQVGSTALPGMVMISPYVLGSDGEAPLEAVGFIGDIDGDGFDDIAIGAPKADFVFVDNPTQRREKVGEVYIIYGNNFGSNAAIP